MDRSHIKDLETGRSSPRVSTLLNLIRGLGVPGRDDAAKLARFFQGPERQEAEDALDQALEHLQEVRQSRARKRAR